MAQGWPGGLLLAVLVLVVLAGVLLLWRASGLSGRVGSFECARRTGDRRSWTSGIASYGAGRLDWHRTVSLSPHPTARWERRELPDGRSGVVEVRCSYRGTAFDLAMAEEALAGLTGWLEAAPPGERGTVHSAF